jgi:hypothetical protein
VGWRARFRARCAAEAAPRPVVQAPLPGGSALEPVEMQVTQIWSRSRGYSSPFQRPGSLGPSKRHTGSSICTITCDTTACSSANTRRHTRHAPGHASANLIPSNPCAVLPQIKGKVKRPTRPDDAERNTQVQLLQDEIMKYINRCVSMPTGWLLVGVITPGLEAAAGCSLAWCRMAAAQVV